MEFFLTETKNIILTRDKLEKRNEMDDLSCLFCSEAETVNHLFFDCVVAKSALRR
jgi:hypothetical protein